jgi:DNA-binding response OmpR family regulator
MGTVERQTDILVIEDERSIVEVLVDLLSSEGYRVATLVDGARVEDVTAIAPRMILLDLMLPAPDGAELCRMLRADERTRALPIVFMTAAAPTVSAQRLLGCTYEALLHKPFHLDEVLALVDRFLPSTLPSATGEPSAGAEGR